MPGIERRGDRRNLVDFLQILLDSDMVRNIQPDSLRLNLLQATSPSKYAAS